MGVLLCKNVVAEVSASQEALLDHVGQLVRAKFGSIVDAHAKTQHQVAELHTQQHDLRVPMVEMEKELNAQRHRGLRAHNEVLNTRASMLQAEHVVERLRQEAALAAATVRFAAAKVERVCRRLLLSGASSPDS